MTERTVRQRYADYKKTFPKRLNDRRCELIAKMSSGFTPEERIRTFAANPGWKEECERREQANLTDAERVELAELTKVVDDWQSRSPWAIDKAKWMEEKDAEFRTALARAEEGKNSHA